MYVEMKKKLQ